MRASRFAKKIGRFALLTEETRLGWSLEETFAVVDKGIPHYRAVWPTE